MAEQQYNTVPPRNTHVNASMPKPKKKKKKRKKRRPGILERKY